MSPKVYFQRVSINWTKESRGMPLAAKRNSCNICFPISDEEVRILTAGKSYSSISMGEKSFTPHQTTERFLQSEKLDFETVSIKRPRGKIIVRYHYSTVFVGAPDRSNRPDISCEILPEELVRIEYNGRFSEPILGWVYHRVIYNIVFTSQLTTGSFVAEPNHFIQDMAQLF